MNASNWLVEEFAVIEVGTAVALGRTGDAAALSDLDWIVERAERNLLTCFL
jgi:hypothetical protein